MLKAAHNFIFLAALVASAQAVQMTTVQANALRPSYAATGNATSVPFGWVDFCARYVGQCPNNDMSAQDIDLNAKNLKFIEHINSLVNATIEPVSDMDHWGVIDRWDIPSDGKGDCEDYVLLKRKMLMDAGFPRQALLVTVVRDRKNEGHAVLTVRTNRGEYALDNMVQVIKPWNATGYRYIKRQSQTNPNIWVTIGDPASAPYTASR